MRLTGMFSRGGALRKGAAACLFLLLAAAGLALGGGADPPRAAAQPAAAPAPAAEDPLGDLVVTPGAGRPLPKLGLVPSISADLSDVLLRGVIQRDLDLSGEFELLPDRAAPDGEDASDPDVDIEAWRQKGVEAVVRVAASTSGGEAALKGQVYLVKQGGSPVFEHGSRVKSAELRAAAHRLADLLIGALTGQNGSFSSRMTFTSGQGALRMAYVIDADGHGARAVSPPHELAIDSAFGKNGDVYWVSSEDDEPYRIRSFKGPISLPVQGSVYGLAFSRDRGKVAVSIGERDGIHVFLGADFASIQKASPVDRAISPAFTPGGEVAYSGAGAAGQRIYVGDRPITPPGVFAGSPTFCNHPDGVIAVFAAGAGRVTDLVRTGERGGPLYRLTAGQGSNGAPACSPDGRLVAFFSTRTTGEGPGLYVMRADGRRPKRISTLLGSSLDWAPLPAPAAAAGGAPAAP